MKIALVSPYDLAVPGGVNSHIHHLAEHFVARGHEVRLIAPASDVRNLSPLAIVVGRPRSIPAGGSIARMAISPRLADPVRRVLAAYRPHVVDAPHATPTAVALILVSSRIWCVDGSRGTLMSTLRKTLLPSVSKSSSVRKLYFANFRGPSFHQGQRVELHRFNLFVRNPFSRRASAPFSPGWLSLARPLNGEPQRRTHILKCERSGGRGFDYPIGIESPAPGTLLASSQNVNAAVFSAHVGDVAHS